MSYTLEYGDGILQQNYTSVTGDLTIEYAKAILTSRYIVFLEEDEEEDDYLEVAKVPLKKLRIFQNQPQVLISGDSFDPKMEMYFSDMTIILSFDIFRSSKCREAYQKWIDSIKSVVCSWESTVNEQTENPSVSTMETDQQIQSGFVAAQRHFCSNCGQRIDGEARFCKYCGSQL